MRGGIALTFLGAILVGAVLLALPQAAAGDRLSIADALFTAVSATCITGLTVIEPGRDLSLFGQGVLLTLVQLGCIGITTLGTFFLVLTGRRLSITGEFALSNAYGATGVRGFRGLVVWVIFAMFFIEAVGTILLWLHETAYLGDWPMRFSDTSAWYRAYFFATMAFCNAGFSLLPDSVSSFATSPYVLITLAVETILGGLGFLVLYNLLTIQFWRRNLIARGRLTLHARVVLVATAFCLVLAFLFFLCVEYGGALKDLPWGQKLSISFFHAVTPRTCGFTVIPMENLKAATRFVSQALMFIGAAPGSAGGGIKVTTFVVFLLTLASIWRGRRETVLFGRTVPEDVVRESFIIFSFFVGLVAIAMTILLLSESATPALSFERLFFETISAVTTTGLSCGDTTRLLSPLGRVVIMVCMFLGRIGAIGVVLLIAGREEPQAIRYPKGELVVG